MSDSNKARRHEPMARHTSWRVGGTADLFIRPATVAGLADFLGQLREGTPLTFIGLGSNLLVRDGGIRGAVVCTSALPRTLERRGDGSVRASAGLPCAALARRCARLGLGPAAFFAGIPGTVGGALAMNAGAFGGESWDSVVEVETIDRHGLVRTRPKAEFDIAYRSVQGPGQEWFLAGTFRFEADLSGERERIRSLLKQRSDTQPLGRPSAGSVFRNPPGDHAGRLIESAGLKGRSIGGAEVSTKHANFIINRGNATAADIEQLIELIRNTVRERFAVELVPEVRIVGETQEAGQ